MRLLDGVLEFDAPALDLEQHAGFLLVQGIAQLILEGGHLRQYLLDTIVHWPRGSRNWMGYPAAGLPGNRSQRPGEHSRNRLPDRTIVFSPQWSPGS